MHAHIHGTIAVGIRTRFEIVCDPLPGATRGFLCPVCVVIRLAHVGDNWLRGLWEKLVVATQEVSVKSDGDLPSVLALSYYFKKSANNLTET